MYVARRMWNVDQPFPNVKVGASTWCTGMLRIPVA